MRLQPCRLSTATATEARQAKHRLAEEIKGKGGKFEDGESKGDKEDGLKVLGLDARAKATNGEGWREGGGGNESAWQRYDPPKMRTNPRLHS